MRIWPRYRRKARSRQRLPKMWTRASARGSTKRSLELTMSMHPDFGGEYSMNSHPSRTFATGRACRVGGLHSGGRAPAAPHAQRYAPSTLVRVSEAASNPQVAGEARIDLQTAEDALNRADALAKAGKPWRMLITRLYRGNASVCGAARRRDGGVRGNRSPMPTIAATPCCSAAREQERRARTTNCRPRLWRPTRPGATHRQAPRLPMLHAWMRRRAPRRTRRRNSARPTSKRPSPTCRRKRPIAGS